MRCSVKSKSAITREAGTLCFQGHQSQLMSQTECQEQEPSAADSIISGSPTKMTADARSGASKGSEENETITQGPSARLVSVKCAWPTALVEVLVRTGHGDWLEHQVKEALDSRERRIEDSRERRIEMATTTETRTRASFVKAPNQSQEQKGNSASAKPIKTPVSGPMPRSPHH